MNNISANSATNNIYNATTPLQHAQYYFEMSFCPIPVEYRGKRPRVNNWQKTNLERSALPDVFCGDVNIGIVLGGQSNGLLDVDIDSDTALMLADKFLPKTGMIFGRHSRPRSHYIYRCETAKYRKIGAPGEKPIVEIRTGSGQQTVFPGSVHASGEPIKFDICEDPAATSYLDIETSCIQLAIATTLLPHWSSGKRHDMALAISGLLAKCGWKQSDTERLVRAVAEAASDKDADDRIGDVADTYARHKRGQAINGFDALGNLIGLPSATAIKSWAVNGTELSIDVPLSQIELQTVDISTDARAAQVFSDKYREVIAYANESDQWYRRRNQVYEPISAVQIQGVATRFSREISASLAGRLPFSSGRAHIESLARINSLVSLSRDDLLVPERQFDRSRSLVGLADGSVFDLATMAISQQSRTFVTRCLGAEYDPGALCPEWHRFLERIFEGDQDTISFIQRAVGYTLSGEVGEQCLFVLIGTGANGKSTFINVLNHLFEDYAATVPMHCLMAQNGGNDQTNDLALLQGKRFVSASEGEAGRRLAETKVKGMTGGDRLTCRRLYGDYFSYDPQFKLWLATNNFPRVTGFDHAIWRRIKVVEFPVTIPEAERDPDLQYRLTAELPGILNWALHGYSNWSANGLAAPRTVKGSTDHYQNENDTIAQFIEDRCEQGAKVVTSTRDLYTAYRGWCSDSAQEALAGNMFGKALAAKGFVQKRGSKGNSWKGLGLRAL